MAVVSTPLTKGQVNRAGRVWAELFSRIDEVGSADALAEYTERGETARLFAAMSEIEWWRTQHARPLRVANAGLRYYLPAEAQVSQRLKRFGTIVDKLLRESTMELTQMGDIGGVRAIVPTQAQVDQAIKGLKRNWTVKGGVRDYVRAPKESGYRAVHVIVVKQGRLIEIQLRTPMQDLWAQAVERDGRRIGAGLKFGRGSAIVQEYYRVASALFALAERGEPEDSELMRRFGELRTRVSPYLDGKEETP